MDRQSLLEQKRQRLQELKKRRMGGGTEELIDHLIEKLQTPTRPPSVNVGIQVGSNTETKQSIQDHVPRPEKEHILYDKAIQATPVRLQEPIPAEPKVEPPPVQKTLETVDFVDEYKLNAALKESIKLINKVVVKSTIDTSGLVDYASKVDANTLAKSSTSPFIAEGISHQVTRMVNAMDTSPHFKELIVVAYGSSNRGSSTLANSPGLAVVYNTDTFFPEFFLHSTVSITTIQFDKVNSNKIIGGLSDGKIVIWDLKHNSPGSGIGLLPVLTTPRFSTISLKAPNNKNNYQQHTLDITAVMQLNIEGNDSLVSFSADGVVNTWSTNLLASPRMDTVVLVMPKKDEYTHAREPVRIARAFATTGVNSVGLDDLNDPTEHKHLNEIAVVCATGRVVFLSNDRKSEHILSLAETPQVGEGPRCDTITDAISLDGYIVTANMDWSLKVWTKGASTPLMSIPTKAVVGRLCRRPHTRQFVTLSLSGLGNKQMLVELWDFDVKVFQPTMTIPVDDAMVTSMAFTRDGSRLITGAADGTLRSFRVHEETLKIEKEESLQEFLGSR